VILPAKVPAWLALTSSSMNPETKIPGFKVFDVTFEYGKHAEKWKSGYI